MPFTYYKNIYDIKRFLLGCFHCACSIHSNCFRLVLIQILHFSVSCMLLYNLHHRSLIITKTYFKWMIQYQDCQGDILFQGSTTRDPRSGKGKGKHTCKGQYLKTTYVCVYCPSGPGLNPDKCFGE